MRKRWPLWALAFLAAAGGAAWWALSRPRTVTVCLLADSAVRRRPNWQYVLNSRFEAVNEIYAREAGIRWKVIHTEELADPSPDPGGMDARRAALVRVTPCDADVLIGITGYPQGPRTASVNPFSHAAIVVDRLEESESQNVLRLAHEIAHLFGATHDGPSDSLMSDTPTGRNFPGRTEKLLRLLRDYPFAKGVAGLQGEWDKRVLDALSESLSGLFSEPGAHAHEILAAALETDGLPKPAIPHLRAAVSGDPHDGAARFRLVVALERDSQPDAAIPILREGVQLEPRDARLRGLLGVALIKQDREEAIDELTAAIRLQPGNAMLYSTLGSVLAAGMGRIDSAIGAYQAALKLSPNLPQAQKGLTATLAQKAAAKQESAAAYEDLRNYPNDALRTYNVGVAEAKAGNDDLALEAFEKAVALRPDFAEAHQSLALMRYLRGDYAGAAAEADAARAAGSPIEPQFAAALKRKKPQ